MIKFKLITSLWCPCVLISFFPIIFSTNKIARSDKYKEIVQDLPVKENFTFYLRALEYAVNFGLRYKRYLDLNLEFGMFLIEINFIKHVQNKNNKIPERIHFRLEQILLKIEVLHDYFYYMVKKHYNPKDEKYKQDMKITRLFYNVTTWPRPPDKFHKDLLNQTKIYTSLQLKEIYGEWKEYYKNVNDYANTKPSPQQSDECIELLAQTRKSTSPRNCITALHCKTLLQGGSEFGYGLSHRLLFMIIARFSRQCVVFSEKEDKLKADKFCSRSFNEVQFIALNNFKLPDIMYEHIALCGLFGHSQFFLNNWLRNLLKFQTKEGCFSDKIATGEFDKNQLKKGKNDTWKITNPEYIMNGMCNVHFTAVAVATLSGALRYLIENYYL